MKSIIIILILVSFSFTQSSTNYNKKLSSFFYNSPKIKSFINSPNNLIDQNSYEIIFLKLQEGKKKRVATSILKIICTNAISYCRQFQALIKKHPNNTLLGHPLLINYLIDFSINKIPFEHCRQIFLKNTNIKNISLTKIGELFDSYLYILSFDIKKETAYKFILNFHTNQYKLDMLDMFPYYITYAEINQIPIERAIEIFITIKNYKTKKQLLNRLNDLR